MRPTRKPLLVAIALVAALGCRGTPATNADGPCPSLPVRPHLDVLFEPAPGIEGSYEIALEVDGAKESCAYSQAGISPAKRVGDVVQSPTTKTESTCKGATVSGITNDGAVAGLAVSGTPAKVTVRISRAGKLLGEGTFTPDYTPDRCGFVKPAAKLALAAP